MRRGVEDLHRADSRSVAVGANSWIRCRRWRAALSLLGALNSLSQLTLKATMPGVPDFYQGTEFWDLSLVDPDNRRPVDFAARAARAGVAAARPTGRCWRKAGPTAISSWPGPRIC